MPHQGALLPGPTPGTRFLDLISSDFEWAVRAATASNAFSAHSKSELAGVRGLRHRRSPEAEPLAGYGAEEPLTLAVPGEA